MPTPRKTKAELSLSGSLADHPARYRARFDRTPALTTSIGNVHLSLPAPEKAAWGELVRGVPAGVLTRADRIVVEIAARLLVKVRSGDAKNSEVSLLISILGKLGMTRLDRAKMLIEPTAPEVPAEHDPWSEFD